MTSIESFTYLLGKPWVSGADGPEAFDCWGLVKYVYRENLGIELPELVGISRKSLLDISRNINEEVAHTWEELHEPLHLCGVSMGGNLRPYHVGLWVDDGASTGVLHAHNSHGVMFQSLQSIKNSGMQHVAFFRFKNS